MTAHRFHGHSGGTRKGERYDYRHQLARAAAAKRHQPTDPCVRCARPLGPMSGRLHYDHNADGTGYLGFSHAQCNLRAGAVEGNRRQRAAFTPGQTRTCSACGRTFTPHSPTHRACSDDCRSALRALNPRRPTAQHPPRACDVCSTTYTPRTTRHRTCSKPCSQEHARRLSRDWHRRHPAYITNYRTQRRTKTEPTWTSRDW